MQWFAHLTDLHLSKFRSRPERSADLLSLCRFLKSEVRPAAAVLSGDIVDAKDYKLFGSEQVRYKVVRFCGKIASFVEK